MAETDDTDLTVVHVDTERDFSGGQVQVFLLLDGLAERGVRNVLCCRPGSRAEEEARRRGLDVRTVPMRNDVHLTSVPRIARAIRETGADLVHLHTGRANALGGLAARVARCPAITTRRMDAPVRRHPFNRWLYGSVRRAVAISPAVGECLARGGVPAEKIRVINSSVDPARLRPSQPRDDLRAGLGLEARDVTLLVLARLTHRKGVDVLLAALARADDSGRPPVCLVAGDGPMLEELKARSRGLDLSSRVCFLGHRADSADLLAACDVFVMPSRAEGLGIAALEAMAAGRPVVGSRVGGLADAIVHERTGLLVPPDDPAALAAALDRVVADPALRHRLGDAGPDRVREGFTADQMVESYLALYREVLVES